MSAEYKYFAKDKKAGMSLDELALAIAETPETMTRQFRLKATVGFGGQIQSLTFVRTDEKIDGRRRGEMI